MISKLFTEGASSINQDRGAIINLDNGLVLIISDGAGGIGGGEKAAEIVIEEGFTIDNQSLNQTDSLFCCDILTKIDQKVFDDHEAGEATAIIIVTDGRILLGASVGDSEAWIIDGNKISDLTSRQVRKPMIGSGSACPIPFGPIEFSGSLIMATDGLFKYTSMEKIAQTIATHAIEKCGSGLIDCVRLRSGALQDDVTILLCKKYSS